MTSISARNDMFFPVGAMAVRTIYAVKRFDGGRTGQDAWKWTQPGCSQGDEPDGYAFVQVRTRCNRDSDREVGRHGRELGCIY